MKWKKAESLTAHTENLDALKNTPPQKKNQNPKPHTVMLPKPKVNHSLHKFNDPQTKYMQV